MKVYLAAPFFSEAQVKLVEAIEAEVESRGFRLFSPRREGVLANMSQADRKSKATAIFNSNCREINNAELILAVIDDRDQGVTWEIGYAYAWEKTIVTFTDKSYGLNVMISECVEGHVRGLYQLRHLLDGLMKDGAVDPKWKPEAAT